MNFPYRRKRANYVVPMERMTEEDRKMLQSFNYYLKTLDFLKSDRNLKKNKIKFLVERRIQMRKKFNINKVHNTENIIQDNNFNKLTHDTICEIPKEIINNLLMNHIINEFLIKIITSSDSLPEQIQNLIFAIYNVNGEFH